MIPQEFREFGLVDIHPVSPHCFRVWSSPHFYYSMYCAVQPLRAYWSGLSIIVEMANGHTRIYHGLGEMEFQTIYPQT